MEDAMSNSKTRFIRSLGYLDADADDHLYSGLMFQPRMVGSVTAIGVLLQAPWVFLALSAALAWSALVPTWSLFDAIYNHGVALPQQLASVPPAPAPRRFAGALAAVATLAVGVALLTGARSAAWVLEAVIVVAVSAVVFRRVCAAADLYNVIDRRWSGGVSPVTPAQAQK
jgi:hypothetical protein